ncbi:glycosyltransferase family 2 protein [Pelosinus baikalensis]|uniref:Glycosyltransferase family 2 protein n=1 Tax=Pelosinus baikalensis TaxID=2892015 RepID=A0ABS8HLU4_9FIRM|nr:glycosyltransferase family 2 protein [Pelosinus baikalensis]
MKISVAMCTYNGEKYLAQQLNSILFQTLLPDEIIICDDNSSDNTKRLLKDFTHPIIKVHHNPINLGSTKNFEQAIKMCSGDIIFLADQDDVWLENKVATIMEAFLLYPHVYMIFTNAFVTDKNLSPTELSLWDYVNFNHKNFTIQSLLPRNIVTGATMAFKKEALEHIYPFSLTCLHDDWMAFIMTAFYPVMPLNEKLIYYRHHDSQQIGINLKPQNLLVKLRSRMLGVHVRHHRKYLPRLKALQNRLEGCTNTKSCRELIEYTNHLEARINLPKNKIARLFAIKNELAGYSYYENYMNALKDWISN